MSLKSFIGGTIGLAAVGGVIGAYSASKRIDGVEPLPGVEIDSFFAHRTPTMDEAIARMNKADDTAAIPPTVVRAYRAPGLMPSHHASVAAFGGQLTKGASYIRSDGAKVTIESTSKKDPIPSVAALYALQALEGSAPRRRRALASIFYNTFRISDMYHYLMHCTWEARQVHDDIIEAALAKDKREIHRLVNHYGERSMEIECETTDVRLSGDLNGCTITAKAASETPDDASKAPARMVGASLHRMVQDDATNTAKQAPRTVMVNVYYTAPNPYARRFTSSPYEIQAREWCADKYGRLLAASVAESLVKL